MVNSRGKRNTAKRIRNHKRTIQIHNYIHKNRELEPLEGLDKASSLSFMLLSLVLSEATKEARKEVKFYIMRYRKMQIIELIEIFNADRRNSMKT